jgi:hypothetical protein
MQADWALRGLAIHERVEDVFPILIYQIIDVAKDSTGYGSATMTYARGYRTGLTTYLL